ncbi:MAG: serine/threonine-protein kinase [Myxococcota bacterium]
MNAPSQPFGQFNLVHRIADGGMGEIFLAADTRLNRPVAIKRVLEKFRTRPDVSRMFEAEATVMSVLRHPNIVRLFESGEVDGVFYISMEYIHGKTLREVVDRAREVGESIPPGLVVQMMTQLGDALGYAHEMKNRDGLPIGLVHRDVNPANLLIGYDGSVKLIDFGIVQTDDELAPEDLEPKGKFAYMSPEQTQGGRVDLRSDLFSLGICFYEALTLYNPFIHDARGTSAVDAIRDHDPAPLAQRNHRLAALDPLMSRLLAKEPQLRVDDAQVFIHELIRASESAKIQPLVPLAAYMADLFEDQKRQEDTLLESVELSSDSTVTVAGNPAPHTEAPPALRPRETDIVPEAPPEPEPFAFTPPQFTALLVLIGAATLIAAYFVYGGVIRHRLGTAVEIAAAATDPTPDAPPPANSVATVKVRTVPAVRLTYAGERASKTARIPLKSEKGRLGMGTGRSPAFDPFAVTIDYELTDGRLKLAVRSKPTATVRGPAGALGPTPVQYDGDLAPVVFQLSKDRRRLELRLEFAVRDPG